MTNESDEIDKAAAELGLTIEPEWKGNVAMFLTVARGMAKLVLDTHAQGTSEAAPVFTPRSLTPRSDA